MGERKDLGFPKTVAHSLSDHLEKLNILRDVRSQGHSYIELRQEGNIQIFYCNVCLMPCFSDLILYDHLEEYKPHSERLAMAKLTLLKPNPWPFSDGVLFFDQEDKGYNFRPPRPRRVNKSSIEKTRNVSDVNLDLVIPGVLRKDKISDLGLRFMGFGQIGTRVLENDKGSNEIKRIWCEWLGKKGKDDHKDTRIVEDHEFAVIAFVYNDGLGKYSLLDDFKDLLSCKPQIEIEGIDGARTKRIKSISDSKSFDFSVKESQRKNSFDSNMTLKQPEVNLPKHVSQERMCGICQRKMLPGKDVATLLNTKTGRLNCSNIEVNGEFHVFHISCLIHWILECEFELCVKKSSSREMGQTSKRKRDSDGNEIEEDSKIEDTTKQVSCVFCPDCGGTGIKIGDDEVEEPTVPLSKVYKNKVKMIEARIRWMASPEELQNCSTGFYFPSPYEGTCQENLLSLKLLRFYRAKE